MSTQTVQEKLLEYKLRIKSWEKSFRTETGRLPSKNDVKADKEIYNAYKTYNHLKSKQAKDEKRDKKDVLNESDKQNESKNAELEDTLIDIVSGTFDVDQSDDETPKPALSGGLGPTPQANGKVLSLFDMMSPPQSSPSKQDPKAAFVAPKSSPVTQDFKTPTKAVKRLDFSDLTPSVKNLTKKALTEQLRQAESPQRATVSISGTVDQQSPVATPFYLNKISKKFSFKDEDVETLPSKSLAEPSTPSRATTSVDFLISPSPLKSERFLSFGTKKKISDLFNETKDLKIDIELKLQFDKELELLQQAELEEEQEEPEENEIPNPRRKRQRITQKRTTRRWKIKPREVTDDQSTMDGKDVQEEVRKLNDQQHQELATYVGNGDRASNEVVTDEDTESSEEEDGSDIDDETFLKPKSTNYTLSQQKLKPISNNFQRLKINDPRSKRFKQRMRRR